MVLSRRGFLYGTVTLPAIAAQKPPDRPNILMIVAEGLPSWAIGCYGNREIRTPHIDRFAQMGTRFSHHFAATPDPAVNRAVLFTGRTPMQLKDSADLSAEISIGKLLESQGYSSSVANHEEAVRFLDAPPAGKPFFLTVNLPALRHPYTGAAQKYADLYTQTRFDTVNPEGAGAVETLRSAASAITSLDEQVQALTAKVIERKLLDHTMVLLVSTSGDNLSHHGHWGTGGSYYEEALNTPMILVWPGRVPAQAARPELVSSYDLLPTLADLLAIEPPARNLCGRSYALLATGKPLPKKEPWRATVFARSRTGGMARINRYKVILHEGAPGELYALIADPGEKVNQFENPQFLTVRNGLTSEWEAWKRRFSA